MPNERYSDNDLLMLKGLYHTSIAKKYFETAKIDKHFSIKEVFSNYVNRCDYILNSVNSMVKGTSKNILDQEILKGDTLFFDSLMDKLPSLNSLQREQIETIIDGYLKGEEILFVDETKTENI